VKVSAVFSISHTAVALGINGSVIRAGYDARSGVGQVWGAGLCGVVAREIEHAMMDEEEGPPRKRTRLEKLVLDTLGIEELRDYIAELKAEIERVEADIERKQGHRSAADAFFRRP
jgi:uncharacterized small protein (DUF1192 family)